MTCGSKVKQFIIFDVLIIRCQHEFLWKSYKFYYYQKQKLSLIYEHIDFLFEYDNNNNKNKDEAIK